jgi:hypothetical protein
MSYINKTVTSYGTEADFVWAFIQSFTSDITAATGWTATASLASLQEVETWSANEPAAQKAVVFTIATDFQINFSRYGENPRQSYWFQFEYGGIAGGSRAGLDGGNYCLNFASSKSFHDATAQRTFKYQIITDKISDSANAKALHIRFGAYDAALPLTVNSGMFYLDNDLKFLSLGRNDLFFVGSTGTPATKIIRLPYLRSAADLTQIEIIKNSIVKENASNAVAVNPDSIWDSTYNSAVGFPLTIDSQRCCYLDNYTVMKC